MATYRGCDIAGCDTPYTEGSMAYCGECHRDFCEYHADLLLVEHYDDYICEDCKAQMLTDTAKERARVEYLRTIDPATAITADQYKYRFVIFSQAKEIARKKYELLKDAKAALEQVHGMVSGHSWQMGLLVSEASRDYDNCLEVLRELVDMAVLQWAHGDYRETIDEISRWRREEGSHFG